ncbi:unnamed protein product [Phaedon cochleariae]|uniref:Uncharacterized protein n=1 Tax=Phaedon cochleariae TaxID=80249 RepID=A0A9N9SJ81_PHACE|nr:unnamed protein product [Phaedon cochleariae]CAG9820378.1 unnamed protein product [Phaedon cochleariae]
MSTLSLMTPKCGDTLKYSNTYKLESDNPFNPEKVDNILKMVLMEAMENLIYDSDKCSKQAKWAASTIISKVLEFHFERYKIISLVTIGEKNSQDVTSICSFLWDAEKDRFATFSMENTHVFGIACCFGLYYE